MYLSKIKNVGNILTHTKYKKIYLPIRYIMFFIVSNIYVYTFYPLVLFLFIKNDENIDPEAKIKRFLSYWK